MKLQSERLKITKNQNSDILPTLQASKEEEKISRVQMLSTTPADTAEDHMITGAHRLKVS